MTDAEQSGPGAAPSVGPAPVDEGPQVATDLPTAGEWAKAQAEIEALKAEMKDRQLRALAELDNVRKRAARDAAASAKFGAEKLLRELLAVVDSLELALKAGAGADSTAQAVIEGVQLTHRQFITALEKHGVSAVNPAGQTFDPHLHEAVAVLPRTDVPANSVVEVMQTGYLLHERLLRPARVVVAKAPSEAQPPA
ncbi:MAG TPA: nucleotide exchange factor GrpE [Nevskiaceae bacterium]|nr:nucleotide exchange factor GrpE [Nevskiaceae bacterium]